MKRRNPRMGCRKIAEQISNVFGLAINKDVVRRILIEHFRPAPGGDGPSWLSVIGQARDSLWSVDLFRCESVLLQSYWVMVVMDIFTRRIIGFGIAAANLDGPSVCRMFNRAIERQRMPRHLSSDHDPLFRFQRWLANLRILEKEGFPFAVVVSNNRALGWPLHVMAEEVKKFFEFHDFDYAAIARAMGCEGVRCESVADVAAALQAARTSPVPYVIDVPITLEATFLDSTASIAKLPRERPWRGKAE